MRSTIRRLALERIWVLVESCRALRNGSGALGCGSMWIVGRPIHYLDRPYIYFPDVETHLGGHKISGAAVTIPLLAALYQEDLEDAFEYAGLLYIPHYPYWYGGLFHETGAVYVGNGFGLCSNYTDPIGCERERKNPLHQPINENVLSALYTRGLLTSTWASEGMWFSYPAPEGPVVADLNLGWDKRYENPNEEYYWTAIRDAIIAPVLEANKYISRETNKVLLHADCTLVERFQSVLRQAVQGVLLNKPEIYALDPVYSSARGAAEMAKRVYWSYNHTLTAGSRI